MAEPGCSLTTLEEWLRNCPDVAFRLCSKAARKCFRLAVSSVLKCGPIPDHVAFIMDGNRRWADRRRLQRHAGHQFGFMQLKECLKWCLDLGIRIVTVYAFSIENFKRPPTEVETLMKLAADKLDELSSEEGFLQRNSIRVQVLGDLELLPQNVQLAAARAMKITRHHCRALLNICMPYTARKEMTTAVQEAVRGVRDGMLLPSDISEELLSEALYTAPHSQVDLMVRTSGETRLSDFMLWQTAGAYISCQSVLWPDFSLLDLARCVMDYQRNFAALCTARAEHAAAIQALEKADNLPKQEAWSHGVARRDGSCSTLPQDQAQWFNVVSGCRQSTEPIVTTCESTVADQSGKTNEATAATHLHPSLAAPTGSPAGHQPFEESACSSEEAARSAGSGLDPEGAIRGSTDAADGRRMRQRAFLADLRWRRLQFLTRLRSLLYLFTACACFFLRACVCACMFGFMDCKEWRGSKSET